MGRRSDHTKEELSIMIVEAAFEFVKDEGISGVSTRKIAKEIGYTVGTLYNIFSNLDDIFLYVNAKTIDILMLEIQENIKQDAPVREQIEYITNSYIEFSSDKYNLWHLLFKYHMSDTQDIPVWYTKKLHDLYNLVAKVISPLGNNDINYYVAIYWSTIHGFCVLENSGKFKRVGIESTNEMYKLFLDNWVSNVLLSNGK